MSKTLRLFFALEISDEIRNKLALLIKEFQNQIWGSHIRWVHPENLHITLRFIGPCKEEQVAQLVHNVRESIATTTSVVPFVMQLQSVQLFPTPAKPHIISVGFHPIAALFQLVFAVEQGVVASGFANETRPYLPHLTLGRIVQHRKIFVETLPSLANYSLPVDQIFLLKSEEHRGMRIYEAIQKIDLSN